MCLSCFLHGLRPLPSVFVSASLDVQWRSLRVVSVTESSTAERVRYWERLIFRQMIYRDSSFCSDFSEKRKPTSSWDQDEESQILNNTLILMHFQKSEYQTLIQDMNEENQVILLSTVKSSSRVLSTIGGTIVMLKRIMSKIQSQSGPG